METPERRLADGKRERTCRPQPESQGTNTAQVDRDLSSSTGKDDYFLTSDAPRSRGDSGEGTSSTRSGAAYTKPCVSSPHVPPVSGPSSLAVPSCSELSSAGDPAAGPPTPPENGTRRESEWKRRRRMYPARIERGQRGNAAAWPSAGLLTLTVVLLVIGSGCAHTVTLSKPPVVPDVARRVPLAVNVLIDSDLRSYVVDTSMQQGVTKHEFEIPVGEPLADTLERVARAAFDEMTVVSAPDDSRATLTMRLASDPIVNVQWQPGWFTVGQRTDCTLAVEVQLLSAGGQQVWQDVVFGQGKHETRRVVNWATAGQAEPAVRQAIAGAADDLIQGRRPPLRSLATPAHQVQRKRRR